MKKDSGFTLLEVLIALAILGTGIIAAMQLFPASLRQSRIAAERTKAANMASSELSRLRALDIGRDFGAWLDRITAQSQDRINSTYSLYEGWRTTVQRMPGATETYRVMFTVQLFDGREETFVTYVTKR